MDWHKWAQRRMSREGAPPASSDHAGTPASPTPSAQPVAPPPSPAALPAPPPGYTWAQHPQYGLIAVPLASSIPPPVRTPQGTVPYVAGAPVAQPQHAGGRVIPFPPARGTCELVKPGDRDTYAELLTGVPDLVQAGAVQAGNSDAVAAELRGLPEFASASADVTAYPNGTQGLVQKVGDLRGGGDS